MRRSNGRPVLLPPGGDPAEAAATVADLDGLIVSGGGDVDPARYGAAPHPETGAPNDERDGWELAGRLGVSRVTVRDALRELAAAGYVETRRGRFGGTFVTYQPDPIPHGELTRTVHVRAEDSS